ncbi:MAG: MotA/TolQ/ExbB proton channel family protein, partial [Planctomycetota bacterium]
GQGTEGPRYELLAEAISVALVTTFWGLLVGIPALFFYGMFQTRIEAFISEAAIETDSLLGRIIEPPSAGSTQKCPQTDESPSSG